MNTIKELLAILDSQEWADNESKCKAAWDNIARSRNIELRKVAKAKVECAKLVEHFMEDERSINALRVAERFADGEATREELDASASGAFDAAFEDVDFPDASGAAAAWAAADIMRAQVIPNCADICRRRLDDLNRSDT